MLSPLLGIAAVNSLLFTAYMQSKKLVSPYGELSLPQIALAGGMAGGVNAVLASPVEMFKVRAAGSVGSVLAGRARLLGKLELISSSFSSLRSQIKMQGQYGGATDKRLRAVVRSTFDSYGFRQGIMRGFKVRAASSPPRLRLRSSSPTDPSLRRCRSPSSARSRPTPASTRSTRASAATSPSTCTPARSCPSGPS